MVPASRLARWVDGFAGRHGDVEIAPAATGLTLQGADGERAELSLPYLPWWGGSVPDVVRHLEVPRRTVVLVVRRRGYACAVVDGVQVREVKIGSRRVQGRTAAGGWSQQRYARRRDKQTSELVHTVAGHAHTLLDPVLDRPGPPVWLATGGDRALVDDVLADPRARRLRALPRATHLVSGNPDRALAAALPGLLRQVRVTLFPAG